RALWGALDEDDDGPLASLDPTRGRPSDGGKPQENEAGRRGNARRLSHVHDTHGQAVPVFRNVRERDRGVIARKSDHDVYLADSGEAVTLGVPAPKLRILDPSPYPPEYVTPMVSK